jgi:hypothetical protein
LGFYTHYIPVRDRSGTRRPFRPSTVRDNHAARREFGLSTQFVRDLMDADEIILAALKVRTPHSDVAVLLRKGDTIKPLISKYNRLAVFNLPELEHILRLIPMPHQVALENTFRRFRLLPELVYAAMPESATARQSPAP